MLKDYLYFVPINLSREELQGAQSQKLQKVSAWNKNILYEHVT